MEKSNLVKFKSTESNLRFSEVCDELNQFAPESFLVSSKISVSGYYSSGFDSAVTKSITESLYSLDSVNTSDINLVSSFCMPVANSIKKLTASRETLLSSNKQIDPIKSLILRGSVYPHELIEDEWRTINYELTPALSGTIVERVGKSAFIKSLNEISEYEKSKLFINDVYNLSDKFSDQKQYTRLNTLLELSKDEPEFEIMTHASLLGFTDFVQNSGLNISKAILTLTSDGRISAEWEKSSDKHAIFEFIDHEYIRGFIKNGYREGTREIKKCSIFDKSENVISLIDLIDANSWFSE